MTFVEISIGFLKIYTYRNKKYKIFIFSIYFSRKSKNIRHNFIILTKYERITKILLTKRRIYDIIISVDRKS